MRLLGELPDGRDAGPMPLWQRWLLVIILTGLSPIIAVALVALLLALLFWSVWAVLSEDEAVEPGPAQAQEGRNQ